MIGFAQDAFTEKASVPNPQVIALAKAVFGDTGILCDKLRLEHRPQQENMALAVAEAVLANQSLLFEAGTGVGKSLAYLIPGIIQSVEEKRKLVVSTHTIALQNQILNKDLKLCRQIFESDPTLSKYAAFQATQLVGKSNYLCNGRMEKWMRDHASKMKEKERAEMERIMEWAQSSKTGLVHELHPAPDPDLWEQINADSSACSRKHCSPESCFYQRAKASIDKSDVVIVNHALLFSLIHAGFRPPKDTRGILFPDDRVVLDEAHTIPDVATEHFGLSVSNISVRRALLRAFNPEKNRGLLVGRGKEQRLNSVVTALDCSDSFFESIASRFLTRKTMHRLMEPFWIENTMLLPLKEVCDALKQAAREETDEKSADELDDAARRIMACANGIADAVALGDENHVYWVESFGRSGLNTRLRSAPIDVSGILNELLFTRETSCLMTSATLTTAEGMERFKQSCGATGIPEGIEQSPFDFKNHMRVAIATDCPRPSKEEGKMDLDYLSDMIAWCANRVEGGTLVLFTNHKEMRTIADRTQSAFNRANRELLIQGIDGKPNTIIPKFKKLGNAVLFGTDTYWTGVDIPGPALSQVILVRLPFGNFSDPIEQARKEHCLARGGNPFADISLPNAQIKFRQGVGRLIRSASDRGIITILDSRIVNQSYGNSFIATLPNRHYQRFSIDNREHAFPSAQG